MIIIEKIAMKLGNIKKIKRGMNLFKEGDTINGVYLVLKGEFEILKTIDFDGLHEN